MLMGRVTNCHSGSGWWNGVDVFHQNAFVTIDVPTVRNSSKSVTRKFSVRFRVTRHGFGEKHYDMFIGEMPMSLNTKVVETTPTKVDEDVSGSFSLDADAKGRLTLGESFQ